MMNNPEAGRCRVVANRFDIAAKVSLPESTLAVVMVTQTSCVLVEVEAFQSPGRTGGFVESRNWQVPCMTCIRIQWNEWDSSAGACRNPMTGTWDNLARVHALLGGKRMTSQLLQGSRLEPLIAVGLWQAQTALMALN